MGLQEDIGFVARRPNAARRAVQRIAAIPALSPTLAKLATPLDRMVHRMTSGRASVTGSLAFPTLLLATVGAKTGAVRTTPLAAIPHVDDLAVIGSNAGSGKIPGWVHNLRANPAATVSYEDRIVDVTAREVDADEHDEIFASAVRIYPGFAGYRERVDYLIPVFMLTAASD